MSVENVHEIINKAATDAAFRDLLLNEPGKALAGYKLSDAEIVVLRNLTAGDFEATTAELEALLAAGAWAERRPEEERYKEETKKSLVKEEQVHASEQSVKHALIAEQARKASG